MKVYVDELPKDCFCCPVHNGVNGRCKLLHIYTEGLIPKDCPLQSLADYTKQVRKEAFEELYKWCEKEHFSKYSIDEFLEQIKGETK